MPDAVLAVDQGTTGTTAMVFAADGAVLGRAYRELDANYPRPGWVEQDPEAIWRSSLEAAAAALRDARLEPGRLAGIGIANQRETTVVWDRATGRPVYPAIVWQSRQTAGLCAELRTAGIDPLVRERTGLLVDPYFAATKVRWILDRDADLRARAAAGGLAFGTVDTWLLWRLTGGAVHATEPTNAARTMLFDIHRQRWDDDLLEAVGVPAAILPEVRPTVGVFGWTVGHDGLPAGLPIAGVAGDQQAALFGQCCWRPGMVKSTYGTGSFAVLFVGGEPCASSHGLLSTVCCDRRGRTAYALEGAIFTTGAAVQWLRDGLGVIAAAAESEELARRAADSLGVYVVPAFTGLGAPYWDADARGAIVGLTRGAGREHVVRATLESIAYQNRDIVEAMAADSGIRIAELRVDGGAAANDLLMQIQADILGIPVDRPSLVESTAAGAAFLAGLALGVWSDAGELERARRSERRFEPEMPADERDRRYAGWKRAVRRVLTPTGGDGTGHAV